MMGIKDVLFCVLIKGGVKWWGGWISKFGDGGELLQRWELYYSVY